MKDPLEYLNDVNVNLDEYQEYSLNDIEKQKMKNKIRGSIKSNKKVKKINLAKKVSCFGAIIFIGILVFGVCFPTYASNIPALKNIISFLNRNKEIEGYEEVVTPVMATVKTDGYDINIESAYYDGNVITLFYNVVGEEKLDTLKQYCFGLKLEYEKPSAYEYTLENGEFIDENTFAGMIEIYIAPHDGSNPPEIFNGTIDITNLYEGYGESSSIAIDAEPIKLSLDSTNMQIKEYQINKKIEYKEDSLDIIGVKEYPTGIVVERKNNVVNEDVSLSYILWDSNKGQLKGIGGLVTESGLVEFRHRLPSEDSDVYIVPYVNIQNKDIPQEEYITKNLIKIEKGKYDLGDFGTFEILDINNETDKTILKLRVTGDQAWENFYLRDDVENEYYRPIYSEDKKVLGILDMEVTYVFNKLDIDKNYYIETSKSENIRLDDQIIKIERN